jgi:FlaA1/EpsC-like NDP-sugar epimerase
MSSPTFTSGKLNALQRTSILMLLYLAACAISWWFAYQLRFDFSVEPAVRDQSLRMLPGVIALKLLLLLAFGQFDSLLSYFSLPDAQRIFGATFIAAIILYCLHLLGFDEISAPRAVILSDFIVSFAVLSGFRLMLRVLRERFQQVQDAATGKKQVQIGIIGAGDVGAALVKDLLARPSLGMKAVVFGDDNRQKWQSCIHGVQVVGSPEYLIEKAARLEISKIVIAMPSAPTKRIREIVAALNAKRLMFELVPSMEQLMNGHVRVSQLRPVDIIDLLGRNPVDLETSRIRQLIQGKVVMVTGAGGSIGSELCLQIQSFAPSLLILVEQCEVQLFLIEQKLGEVGAGRAFLPLVADILDENRMRAIFSRHHPQIIFHTAAHKHVPLMEHQPIEALQNNTIGTMQLANWSIEFGVGYFVQISTDKAINPTNIMGATKRLAELYLQAITEQRHPSTKFIAVRFGNVLGSSGSVIPTFKQQIAKGGPVTVTHPDVTRFFMTVQEAVGLILQSATQGSGGEIFVLDMGNPVKIVDLARQLIELSGLEPDVDIDIKFTGLRPGEKLYEEINHNTENMVPTNHAKIMRFTGKPLPFDTLHQGLLDLHKKALGLDNDQIKLEIQRLVPEYRPYLTVA